jgi:hypothetical protein
MNHGAEAVRSVLEGVWRREPLAIVDSPPGAGKSRVAELVAGTAVKGMSERVLVATQTNRQAEALALRLAKRFPSIPLRLLLRRGRDIPSELAGFDQVRVVRAAKDLPDSPSIVVTNAQKATWLGEGAGVFDRMVVDEAYQLKHGVYQQLASLADHHLLIGDPGQIAPVVSVDVTPWRADPAGPHVAAPRALLSADSVPLYRLSVSWRLPADSAVIVQEAFYPALPFTGKARTGERGLRAEWERGDDWFARVGGGVSLVPVLLPARITGPLDVEALVRAIDLAEQLISRSPVLFDEQGERPFTPKHLGIVCSRREQVSLVQQLLPRRLTGVLVETANRWQGLERPVVIAIHPLSGLPEPDEFSLDPGRFCVSLSRHSVACFLVARSGIGAMLDGAPAGGERYLGVNESPRFEGMRAHLRVLNALPGMDLAA